VGKAQYVVSWNIRDFPPSGSFAGVEYLTLRAFLDGLDQQPPLKDDQS
jgi:hypothetical protein